MCHPATQADEIPCAKRILAALARQAYRRPATDNDLEELLGFYQSGRNGGDFETGIRTAIQAMIASPEFVFRFERTPANAAPGSNFRISDLELASRLSYFLWSSSPDEQLIALASQNKLHEPAVLEKQVRRMLADPKSEALTNNFADQWLHLQNLKECESRTCSCIPISTASLVSPCGARPSCCSTASCAKTAAVTELLTANYTFVDERLAKHYGIPNVAGEPRSGA